MSGHEILTTSRLVVALKGLAERLALFTLKYFMLRENTVRRKKSVIVLRARGYLLGCREILVSPFVSKLSISPSPMSLAAIALIDASSKAFLQLSLP